MGVVKPVVGQFPQHFRLQQLLADAQEQQVVAALEMPVRDVRDPFQGRTVDEAVVLVACRDVRP